MKSKIRRIAVIGLGLIGGSLAMALERQGYYVIGISRKRKTVNLAKRKKAINEGYTRLNKKALNSVDLIFIATPLNQITEHIKEIGKILKENIVLTDVGSTKSTICDFADKSLSSNITFIGGHPMAGTEESGFLSAKINLFQNCTWVLTPVHKDKKTKDALKILQALIKQIKAKPIITTPDMHDKAAAIISHLPLLVSIGLCNILRETKETNLKNLAMQMASSGFRDSTRIGGGNPEMNSNLLTSNYLKIKYLLPKYLQELSSFILLTKNNPKKLQDKLAKISKWRNRLY